MTADLTLTILDSVTRMNGLTIYVKEIHPFARELFLGKSEDSYLCFFNRDLLNAKLNSHYKT